jgi:uncharacterized Zn-binding protein involved in type VI secretion
MPAAARLGDKAQVQQDAHGCPACPHPGIGPIVTGSPDVFINNLNAGRQDDLGVHAICCGPNTFTLTKGSPDVYVNNKPLMRMNDKTTHCGGNGNDKEGSPDVMIDDGAGGMGGLSFTINTITIKSATAAATQQGQTESGSDADEDETDDPGQTDVAKDDTSKTDKNGSIAKVGWSQARAFNGASVDILIECKDPKGSLQIEIWAASADNTQDKSVKKLPDATAAATVKVTYKVEIPPDAAGTNECHFYFIVKDESGGQKKSEPIFVDRAPFKFSN